jgi:two-component system chemotaxis sensor kinase CheA
MENIRYGKKNATDEEVIEAAKLSHALGKEVEFTFEGDGGSIPKRLFEDLDSVLVHLLRNSLDHGVEIPEAREEHGKTRNGSVKAVVEVDEQGLRFELTDDGRGIDYAQISEAATANEGLDPAVVERFISENEPWRILFLSGFSTAEAVTEISGRGIGLSAVKSLVDRLGGTIQVESTLGQGTTFKIRVPIQEHQEAEAA